MDLRRCVGDLRVRAGAVVKREQRHDLFRARRIGDGRICRKLANFRFGTGEVRMIYGDVAATVGRTPMVELSRMAKGLPGRVAGKLEMRNPCGSVKDRLGIALIEDAERRGALNPGATIIEPTGGNTGIGLAFAAALRGYRLMLTMPDSMSKERVALLRQLGAEVVLTPEILMRDAVVRARQLVSEMPDAIMLDQFSNPANPELHRRTTAVEIWDDTKGAIDVFVSAVGTGGTITGVGEVLKKRKSGSRGGGGASRRRRALRPSAWHASDARYRRWVYSRNSQSLHHR